jgi:hypothetical protein
MRHTGFAVAPGAIRAATLLSVTMLVACLARPADPLQRLAALPLTDQYCRDAQRVVTRTQLAVKLILHTDFDAFVKSKALIEGPTIQQFNWYDSQGALLGVSCKLKSADHLNAALGPGSAGPDGLCQDMNRAVYRLVAAEVARPRYREVIFDSAETVNNEREPGMTGPDWLRPYTMTRVDEAGALHIVAKGFVVNFTDARFATMPERFRGVHYCHFLAPEHLRALLAGTAEPGAVIGRAVDPAQPMPAR